MQSAVYLKGNLNMMKYLCTILLVATGALIADETPESALQKLISGNQRFKSDALSHCYHAQDRREATTSTQKPFAIILGCADSRVPPETVFDQNLGDLFVVRVAGNVAGPLEIDSIDFSILVNNSALVVVLGHENCGAVKAVMAKNTRDVESVAALIAPAVAQAEKMPGNAAENAIKANIRAVRDQLKKTSVVARAINDKKLQVVGAYYELTTGNVEFLKD